MSAVCPHCGSEDTQRRGVLFSSSRVCRACGARYTRPTPLWERLLFAAVFLVPGALLGIVAVGLTMMILSDARPDPNLVRGSIVCSGSLGMLAVLCLVQGFRELAGRARRPRDELDFDSPCEVEEAISREQRPTLPPLVPQEEAESLVRKIAEKYQCQGILRKLGNIREDNVANAVACFAPEMGEDETPLTFIDTSFLGNGKAGFLLTNRGLYSSFRSRPFWLSDINDISYTSPGFERYFFLYLLIAGILVSAYLGGMMGAGLGLLLSHLGLPPRPFTPGWSILSISLTLYFGVFVSVGFRQLQIRLLVNGKAVYNGRHRLRGAFWIELLTALAEAARQAQAGGGDTRQKPSVVVLETTLQLGESESVEVRHLRNPSWQDIEQNIRDLDQKSHPSLRIWAGEVEQAPALDIFGGNGKYALRELGDGWVYYDPSGSADEVEVCISGAGYRCAAFYVCTDVDRVLEIARHFVETGTPE